MAKNLNTGERVYVPVQKISGFENYPLTIYNTTVCEVSNRSAKINLPNGEISDWIGTSLIHRDIGIYIINIGDFETEETLLNPLSKSILQFCRLLINEDSMVTLRKIRTTGELTHYWNFESRVYKFIILIGHGSQDGLLFGNEGWINPQKIHNLINNNNNTEKIFISLACQTGYKSFSSILSKLPFCSSFIAPFHSVHGAIASQFCQTFLVSHLLEGRTPKTAFNTSRRFVPGSSSFRLWQKGILQAGPKG